MQCSVDSESRETKIIYLKKWKVQIYEKVLLELRCGRREPFELSYLGTSVPTLAQSLASELVSM
jgi:hypothetical protein